MLAVSIEASSLRMQGAATAESEKNRPNKILNCSN